MRKVLKQTLNLLALLCMLPALVVYGCAALVCGQQAIFPGWSQALSLLPGKWGEYLRRAFYRCVLAEAGEGCVISFGTIIASNHTRLGPYSYVGAGCCLGDVTIERDVLIGSHVAIPNGNRQHGIERLDVPVREQPGLWPKITIGEDTWIGDRAVIMANVGQHCVVGAGAVVTKPVPDYAIVQGVPARVVGDRRQLGSSRSPEEQQA